MVNQAVKTASSASKLAHDLGILAGSFEIAGSIANMLVEGSGIGLEAIGAAFGIAADFK